MGGGAPATFCAVRLGERLTCSEIASSNPRLVSQAAAALESSLADVRAQLADLVVPLQQADAARDVGEEDAEAASLAGDLSRHCGFLEARMLSVERELAALHQVRRHHFWVARQA